MLLLRSQLLQLLYVTWWLPVTMAAVTTTTVSTKAKTTTINPMRKRILADYCAHECVDNKTRHVVCTTEGCKPHPNVTLVPVTFAFRKYILDKHNKLRYAVAKGEKGGFPAANMCVMNYDMELEFIISCWLASMGKFELPECTGLLNHHYSDLIMLDAIIPTRAYDVLTESHVDRMTDKHFDEVKEVTRELIDKPDSGGPIEHYRAMVAGLTRRIGCAVSNTLTNRSWELRTTYACLYVPMRWFNGRGVYLIGPAASLCPLDIKASIAMPGMCGEPKPWPKEAYLVGNHRLKQMYAGSAVRMQSTLYALLLIIVSWTH